MNFIDRIKSLFVRTQEAIKPRHFTPTQSFFSEELRSEYSPGLEYTARPEDIALRAVLDKWIADGKVIELASRRASVIQGV